MKLFVVDASVTLAWCLPRQATPETEKLLDQIASGTTAIAPCIWPSEAANALWSLERRQRLSPAQALNVIELLRAMPISVDHQPAGRTFSAAKELAGRYGLTVYDACYLELALRRQLPLATADRHLRTAAKKAGVEAA